MVLHNVMMNEIVESSKEALKKEVIYHIYNVILNMWLEEGIGWL